MANLVACVQSLSYYPDDEGSNLVPTSTVRCVRIHIYSQLVMFSIHVNGRREALWKGLR